MQSLKKEFRAAMRKMDEKISQAKKYVDRKNREYELYKRVAKNGKAPKVMMIEGIGPEDYEKMMETETRCSAKAYALGQEMGAQVKKIYALNENYCKAVLGAFEKLVSMDELEREMAEFKVDDSLGRKTKALVAKLATLNSRIEDMESARDLALDALKKEVSRLDCRDMKNSSRPTSEQNMLAFMEKSEKHDGEEKTGRRAFEAKFMEGPQSDEAKSASREKGIEELVQAALSEFPVIEKSYPNYLGQFKETLRAIALAYVENGYRLTQTSLFVAFPGKVKPESTYVKLCYKPIRVSIDSYGMLRLLVDVSDKEAPVIFFVGPKAESEKVMPKTSLKQAIESAKKNERIKRMFVSLKPDENVASIAR